MPGRQAGRRPEKRVAEQEPAGDTPGLSEYEAQRERRIAANQAKLRELDITPLPGRRPPKPVTRGPKTTHKRQKLFAEPTRRSSRVSGGPAPVYTQPELEELLEQPQSIKRVRRPSNKRRLSPAQSEKLDALDGAGGVGAPSQGKSLSSAELKACGAAEINIRDTRIAGKQLYTMGNAEYYRRSRQILREQPGIHTISTRTTGPTHCLVETGLRLPCWVADLQKVVMRGKSEANINQTMFSLERACCGLGLRHRSWPGSQPTSLGGVIA